MRNMSLYVDPFNDCVGKNNKNMNYVFFHNDN